MTMLKQHRLANGLTLRELAKRIGVSIAACSNWETGRATPSAKAIPKLARVFNLSPLDVVAMLTPAHKAAVPA